MLITIVVYVMMVVLIATGVYMIYEGAKYIEMREKNPDIPPTIYAASTLAFVVGIMDIIFGIAHYWFLPEHPPPKWVSFIVPQHMPK